MRSSYKVMTKISCLLLVILSAGCCGTSSTGLALPTIVLATPQLGSTTACPASTISATFSEAMIPATINGTTFTLATAGSGVVAGQVTYNSSTNTAVLTPTAKLLAGTLYTATISTGVTDLYGNRPASNYVLTFTTASNGCNPPPAVLTINPAVGSATACPNAAITAGFSEAMNAATINASTFKLTGPGTAAVSGQVTYNAANNTAVFTPSANLASGTLYTITVGPGVQDLFGNTLASAFISTFTTAANGCHPPPALLTITPGGGATGVCPNMSSAVVATFNEAMNPATINAGSFTLSPNVVGTVSHDSTNTIFTFTPSSSLALNATYTATITTAAQDTFGNPLPNPITSSFTTAANGCQPPPQVTVVSPVAAATASCPNKIVTATFSEAMNPLTINAANFGVMSTGGAPVAGIVTYNATNNTAIFTPTASLALNTGYTITVGTGVQDLFGNPLAQAFVSTFATGANSCLPAAPPITVTPANGVGGICPATTISATFAQAMNATTLNATTFVVTGPGGVAVNGSVSADSTGKIFNFVPTAPLALSTTYTATISTGAQDIFGNPLASNYVWTFTTGASTCVQPTVAPIVIAITPPLNALGVCANSFISATFSEAMKSSSINATTFLVSNGVTGTVSLDATGTIATFTPAASLPLNTVLTGTITTGAQDVSGNALASNYVWSFNTALLACQPPVPLGTAANFEVLAGSTVTNTGGTVVTGGDLGLTPGTSVTGFPLGLLTLPAAMHISDLVAAQAQLDLGIAYNYVAGLQGGAALPADVSGRTLTPGLYKNATSVILSGGNLTLDAQGNANAVFIFQVGTTLTTLSGTQIVLAGGAQAKNIFWQVGSSATLGTTSVFKGTILALQSITLQTGANLEGRALARNAAVTMDTNVVTAP